MAVIISATSDLFIWFFSQTVLIVQLVLKHGGMPTILLVKPLGSPECMMRK